MWLPASLCLALMAALARGETNLVPAGATWRFLDNGTSLGTNWHSASFDDSGWPQGPAQLGYGDGDEATVVGFGAVATNKHITTYFRRTFQVADPAVFEGVSLNVLRDDGAVIYLNGREVVRNNLPGGTISNGTRAVSSLSGTSEQSYVPMAVAPTELVAGRNVIAVEIHQADATSSDVSFDLQLVASPKAGLVRGPYLQMRKTNGATIRWRTDLTTDSRVRFGTSATQLTNSVSSAARTNEHVAQISGLAPETRYFYSVGTANGTLAGGTNYFFITAPPAGTVRPVRLWALGDSGTADANARGVRDAYLNHSNTRPVDVWLMLGDNAYDKGTDAEYQAAVFDMYPMFLRNSFVWPTIGNHETDQSRTAVSFPYLDMFSLPANAEAGGVASGTEKYYSFDHANIHFICLDSMTSSRSTNGAMLTWLRADLQSTMQDWIIAFWHHPPYTKGSHDSDVESDLIDVRAKFLPVLESYGVDLVLGGHSHCYERSYLLNGHHGLSTSLTSAMKLDAGDGRVDGTGAYRKETAAPDGKGAVYLVAGSSGKATGGLLNHPAMFTSLNELGSVVIDVFSNRLDASFVGINAVVRDHFTIIKGLQEGTSSGPPPQSMGISPEGSGRQLLQFNGAPNVTYRVESAEDLVSPVWLWLTNATADSSGMVQFSHTPGDAPARVFRVTQQ